MKFAFYHFIRTLLDDTGVIDFRRCGLLLVRLGGVKNRERTCVATDVLANRPSDC